MPDAPTDAHPIRRWLGREARDKISGVSGICQGVSLQPSGHFMLAIQPKGDGATRPESFLFDVLDVEDLGKGLRRDLGEVDGVAAFQIGDTVRHRFSPFAGVVTSITWWINGCVQYTVAAPLLGEDGRVVYESLLEGELQAPAAAAKSGKTTGGPSRPAAARPGRVAQVAR